MIEEILPPWVATATFKGDDPAGWLWPAEAALVERAVESRVREFTTGRMCARKALAQLGAETGPILSGDQREALWPMGVTGSITHCRGYRAAAVAWQKQVLGIGIDAELDSVLPDGLLDLVASEQERAWMARQPGPEPWDRLLFSAKESVYKALYPLTRRWLDFADVQVTFLPDAYSFAATVRPEMSACAQEAGLLRGRYLRRDGLILTALLVPLDCSGWVRRVQSSADPV
jgi:4'-phosphopantetheinyl transferase EntD